MTLHERIASLRRAAGLSQEALAAEVNVTRQAIGKWETGASLPGVENLQALASALHVSCDELLTGEKPEAKNGAPEGDGITVAGVAALLNAENAAREQGTQRQRRALLALAAAVVCVCAALIVCAVLYHSRMQTMSEQLNGILNRVSGIETGIDIRIGNIQNAIQSSLNEQASILASYDWQYGTPKGTESALPDGHTQNLPRGADRRVHRRPRQRRAAHLPGPGAGRCFLCGRLHPAGGAV